MGNRQNRKRWATLVVMLLLLSSCGNLEKVAKKIETNEASKEANISTGRVSKNAYQALMQDGKYVTSAARGLSASRLNSNYNLKNFERGLLRLSQGTFSPDSYYMQEGQKITAETLNNWYGRKSDSNKKGLNPSDEAAPLYLQQVEEYDFLDANNQSLAGVSIGVAINSVYYTETGSQTLADDEIRAQGKEIAQAILANLRLTDGLEDIPIVLCVYQQAAKDDIAGGRYLFKAVSQDGSKIIDNWEDVNENYVALPVKSGANNEATTTGISSTFDDFKSTVQGFFPNLSGVAGVAHFIDGSLNKLAIEITSKYSSQTEIESFTQYIGKLTESQLSGMSGDVEILINSVYGPQAFVAKNPNESSVYTRVFK